MRTYVASSSGILSAKAETKFKLHRKPERCLTTRNNAVLPPHFEQLTLRRLRLYPFFGEFALAAAAAAADSSAALAASAACRAFSAASYASALPHPTWSELPKLHRAKSLLLRNAQSSLGRTLLLHPRTRQLVLRSMHEQPIDFVTRKCSR